MAMDATQLGFEATMNALRQLLAERFGMTQCMAGGSDDNPLFDIGLGLSSLEGIEFLCEVEKHFGVRFKDLDWWVYETPTLASVSQYVIDLSKQQHPASQSR